MKKKLAMVALLSSLLVPAAYAEDPIKIGFIAELSGPPAVLGNDQYDGYFASGYGKGSVCGGHYGGARSSGRGSMFTLPVYGVVAKRYVVGGGGAVRHRARL